MKSSFYNNFLPPVTILCGFVLFLSACSTPESRQAKADAAVIGKNDASAQVSIHQAQTANDAAQASNQSTGEHLRRAQTLLERIDAKDHLIDANQQ